MGISFQHPNDIWPFLEPQSAFYISRMLSNLFLVGFEGSHIQSQPFILFLHEGLGRLLVADNTGNPHQFGQRINHLI